ncbi:Uncharacterised protein [Shewanella baltica]|nr:hypothetical protein [Shewanella baltica]SUI87317.1 Uncharacterised protein [Shewanella baltica]
MDLNLVEHAFELKDDRWIFKAGLAQYPQARQAAKLCTRLSQMMKTSRSTMSPAPATTANIAAGWSPVLNA